MRCGVLQRERWLGRLDVTKPSDALGHRGRQRALDLVDLLGCAGVLRRAEVPQRGDRGGGFVDAVRSQPDEPLLGCFVLRYTRCHVLNLHARGNDVPGPDGALASLRSSLPEMSSMPSPIGSGKVPPPDTTKARP